MKRNEVKQEYMWDLSDIFVNEAEWEKEFAALSTETVNILSYKGKLGDKAKLLEFLKFNDVLDVRFSKVYVYTMFLKDQNGLDTKASELNSRAKTLLVQLNSMSAFVTPELSSQKEAYLNELIADPDFKDYDYMIGQIVKNKKHILSEKEEVILAKAGKALGAFSDIFSALDNIELPFPYITVDGKKEKLSHGKYSLYLQNKDRKVRRKAFEGMYEAIGKVINTITATFSASVNKDNFLADVKGYKSALEKATSSNDVPPGVFTSLLKQTNKNRKYVHDYIKLRKSVMNIGTLHMYDLYTPMFENADISCDYEAAYKLVLDGLAPMGEEYINLLKKAKAERWIDVEETEAKRSGAYSCGVPSVHPYVLLNYTPTTHDIFTIAHEMGHAMHSYYSSKNQPVAKENYVIFVAEVASTVNEVLLLKHLIKTTKDANIKRYLLSYYLDMFRTTMFRQTMFAEFEYKAHEMEAKGEPLTVESLSEVYYALNKKYYGSGVKHDNQIRYEWARIPHFYRAFYVYQYATGITSAVNIANDILKNGQSAVDRYKKFLSAGSSKSPYEILKDAGVDLMTADPYDVAFEEFKATLEELKTLV